MAIVLFLLFQIIIFVGLIFLFRNIMTKNVVSATRHIEELNQDFTKKEQELNSRAEELKLQSLQILKTATEDAEKIKAQTLKDTECEKDGIISHARLQSTEMIQQAEQSRQALLSELQERISKEAVNKACQLIQDALPEQFKENVHLHWVEELMEDGLDNLKHMHIPNDVQEVKISSAFGLTAEQRKKLLKKLNDVFGREITLQEEVDPKVVAGLVISIGSLVLDGSLRNKINERVKSG